MRNTVLLFLLAILPSWPIAVAQQNSASEAISNLLQSFSESARAGKPLDSYLAPGLRGPVRDREDKQADKQFKEVKFTNYEMSRDLHFSDNDHAELTADVEWTTKHSDFRQTAALHFVRVNGTWYFQDFDFFRFNWWFAIGGAVLGIAWAAVLVRMLLDWKRRHFESNAARVGWFLLLFLPIVGVVAYWVLVSKGGHGAVVQQA